MAIRYPFWGSLFTLVSLLGPTLASSGRPVDASSALLAATRLPKTSIFICGLAGPVAGKPTALVGLGLTGSSTNASCGGQADGTATVTASGGQAPYAYAWATTPVQTTATATGLAAGTYTVTVTDNAGTQASTSFTVGANADVTPPTALAKNATLTLDASGSATLAAAAVNNGSFDNCSSVSLRVSPSTFSCADLNPPTLPRVRKGSLQLTGASSQYVLSNTLVNGTAVGTFETWLKTTTNNIRFSGILVTSAVGADGGSRDNVVLRWDGGRVACDGLWSVTQTATSPALNDGQWHHVAVVGDGSVSKLYIDGALNATGTLAPAGKYSRRIMLGAEYGRTPGYYGTLELDNSRVWSVARTPAQLLDGMNNEQLADATGLVLSYSYDEGAGSTLTDASGNNNTATLYPSTSLPTFTATGGVPLQPRGVPVTLTVTDAAGNSSTASTYVTVQAPAASATALSLSKTTVDENVPVGTVVGTLSFTSSGPCPSSGATYELVGASGTDFAKFSIGTGANANQLLLATVPDYETQARYTVQVRMTDQNYSSVVQTFTINVADLIELSGSQTTACNNSGSATVAVVGTATGYSYAWATTPVQTTATATGLAPGAYTVTVSKAGMASATRSFTILGDVTAPVALKKNVTLTLDASGTASLTAADLNNGSLDNCAVTQLNASARTFSCADMTVTPPVVRKGSLQLTAGASQYSLSNALVSGTAVGTFETWVKTTVANPQYGGIIVTSTAPGDGGSNNGIYLRWNGGGRVACEGFWNVAQAGTSAALNDGQWHHVAAVGDGSTCKLYIDGALNATGTSNPNTSTYSSRIMLGAERSRTAGYFTTVELAGSRVWNVARTPAQLLDGMSNEQPADATGLVLDYSYETATSSAVYDASGNGRHATLYPSTSLPTITATGGVLLQPHGVPVTLTVTDAAGNSSTATAYVTVLQPSASTVPTRTWLGTASTSWGDCRNWAYGLVPDASTASISIPAGQPNYPALSGTSLTVGDLRIESGASLAMGSTVLNVTGNLLNAGPALSGPVQLTGPGSQSLAGSFSSVTIDKASGTTTLSADASVSTALLLPNGPLNTATYTLTLGSGAIFSESATGYVTGAVQTTRTLSTAAANNFGGLGLTLTPAAGSTMPGATLVRRTTGKALDISSNPSILRYFDIQPTVDTGLNVDLTLTYRDSELNGLDKASLALFKSENGPSGPWVRQPAASLDASANTASLAGVSSFSVWTLAHADAPLPVKLVSFTAQAEGPAARLRWATASEQNSTRFEVERSPDGRRFVKVGEVAAQGSRVGATAYTFLDAVLPGPAATYYYRLRQVDLDGAAHYSPVQVVTLADEKGSLTLAPNPARSRVVASGLPVGTAVEMIDVLGRRVLLGLTGPEGQAVLELPAGLVPGVYVVRGGAQARRLVVE